MNTMYSAELLMVLTLTFLRLIGYRWAHPLLLHLSIWILVFLVGIIYNDDFYALEMFFWGSWVLWMLSFFLGSVLLNGLFRKERGLNEVYLSLPSYNVILNIFNAFFLILSIVEGINGGYGGFMINLRMKFINGEPSVLNFFIGFFTFLWPLFLYELVLLKNRKNLIALVIYLLIYTMASGGKFGIFMTLFPILLIFSNRENFRKKFLLLIGVVSLALILLIGWLRGQSDADLTVYLFAPLVAFQSLEDQSSLFIGHETFRFFYSFFSSIGLSAVGPPDDFYEYVSTPFLVNVFSAMRSFYMDFGFLGVTFGGFFYGAFFTYTYNGYRNGMIIRSVLYVGFAFSILSVPFADLLFLNLSLFFRTILISIFLLFLNNNIKELRKA